MKFSEVHNENDLWRFMTDPSENLIRDLDRIKGDMLVLGGSGKMGKELVGLIRNADQKNGYNRKITVASTFSNREDIDLFESMGVHCMKGDLSDEIFLQNLPDSPLVFYMMGFKFGSSSDWRKAFHLNSIVPYLIGKKYPNSKIVVFSSGNPYPHTPGKGQGCSEATELSPRGIYGWSIVARESSFSTTALSSPDQKICFYRLMYAQHLYYGVLIDIARMILNNEPISLKMPAVNLISQRDANEVAIRSLGKCSNPPLVLNVAGPVLQVKEIAEKIGDILNKEPVYLEDEANSALLADDRLGRSVFGNYRDTPDKMISAAAIWVKFDGKYWNKPTYFGKADHRY